MKRTSCKYVDKLLKHTKKWVNIRDCKNELICSGSAVDLINSLGSEIYYSKILFYIEDNKSVNVFIDLSLEKKDNKKIKVHNLKIKPQYFNDVVCGIKTFEVRKNDRDFEIGDLMVLEAYDNKKYTGSFVNTEITYILDDPRFCKEGYVILGFKIHLEMGGILQ